VEKTLYAASLSSDMPRRSHGRHNQLPKVTLGVKFTDEIDIPDDASSRRCRLIPSVTKIRR
jgi:hypothetical protein